MKLRQILAALLLGTTGILAACGESEPPLVLYSVSIAPTADDGLMLGLMNFRPDIVMAGTAEEKTYELTIGDESGVLAWVTARREELDDGHVRVVVTTVSSRPLSILVDRFHDLDYTINGSTSVQLGEQLPKGEHKMVLQGRPSPEERDRSERRQQILDAMSPPQQ